jgi:D-sedoheptulose 7-phosphate isomerase
MSKFTSSYLMELDQVAKHISIESIEKTIDELSKVKQQSGRVFILGVGGSAANASHAVNDFRKLADIEAYSPTDNVSEITARTNDHGWENIFSPWLKTSKLSSRDCIFILSVGGGDKSRKISVNLCEAVDFAQLVGAKIMGIVGRDGGYTAKVANPIIMVPTVNPELVTQFTESFQQIIWHLIVSHPKLKINSTTW